MGCFQTLNDILVSCTPERVNDILGDLGYRDVKEEDPVFSHAVGHLVNAGGIYVEVFHVVNAQIQSGVRNVENAQTHIYLGLKYLMSKTGPQDKSPRQIVDEAGREFEQAVRSRGFEIGQRAY